MWDGFASSFMSNKTRSLSLLSASLICFAVSKSLLFACLTFCLSSLARRSAPARCTTTTTGHRHCHDDGHHDLLVLSVFFVFTITVSFSELRINTLKEGKSWGHITRSITILWLVICERGHGLHAIHTDPSQGWSASINRPKFGLRFLEVPSASPLFPCPGSPTDRVTQSSNAVKAVTKMQKVPSASTSRKPTLVVRLL